MAGRGEDLDSYDSLRGLAFRRPYVAAAMGLFLLSLGGFPPTAGFFAKFFVFAAAINAHELPLALWGIATSAISVFYYLRVALLMYTRPRAEQAPYNWSRTSLSGGRGAAAHRRRHARARHLCDPGAQPRHPRPARRHPLLSRAG